MQYPQTRYQDTISPGINNSQLSLATGLTPPTRTQGILTIGRLQSNTEDVLYNGVSGNTVTITLRGLSQTALTPTTVAGNQKVHNTGESLEITTHHNYDTDLLRKTENDTVTGLVLFQNSLETPSLLDINGKTSINTPAAANAVNFLEVDNSATGANVILRPAGTDTNISVEAQAKGTGTFIVPDGSTTKTTAAPTTNAMITNKLYVDTQIASISTSPVALFERVTYGDIITPGQLLYEDTPSASWKLVTATPSTWYNRLAISQDSGNVNDTNKLILLKGLIPGQTFANINPTFSSNLTGTDNPVGNASITGVTLRIDNTGGAESVVTGGTVSARQQGSPAGAMNVQLVAENYDQGGSSTPACYFDATNHIMRGAILASATIAQALFSGTYQNLSFSFGSVKIPAGVRVFLVFSLAGAQSASNFYQVQAGAVLVSTTTSTPTWTGTLNAGNYTLTVISTSPVGYQVKAYTGTNGSFGLAPSNSWSRCLGTVLSSTSFYFDPDKKRDAFITGGQNIPVTAILAEGFETFNLGFCPSKLEVDATSTNTATTTLFFNLKGYLQGDNNQTQSPGSTGNLLGNYPATNSPALNSMFLNTSGTQPLGVPGQNGLYFLRLENGFYSFIGYPSGANFLTASQAGSTTFRYGYIVKASS